MAYQKSLVFVTWVLLAFVLLGFRIFRLLLTLAATGWFGIVIFSRGWPLGSLGRLGFLWLGLGRCFRQRLSRLFDVPQRSADWCWNHPELVITHPWLIPPSIHQRPSTYSFNSSNVPTNHGHPPIHHPSIQPSSHIRYHHRHAAVHNPDPKRLLDWIQAGQGSYSWWDNCSW